MSLEKQTIYGWPVAIDLFLAGSGAGVFLIGYVMNLSGVQEPSAGIMLLTGPLLVLVGACFLLADITVRSRIARLFANRRSWTSRGAWILTLFIISGTAYASTASSSFIRLPLINSRIAMAAGIVAAIFALFVLLYPGFLMGAIRAVPLWSTPLLPVLFLFSGLANGLAFAILIAVTFRYPLNTGSAGILHNLEVTAVILILLQAAALAAFLTRVSRGNIAARESLRFLSRSLFPEKMFSLGLFVPFLFFLFGLFTTQTFLLVGLTILAALLVLGGGLYLRHAITQAGVYLPRFDLR